MRAANANPTAGLFFSLLHRFSIRYWRRHWVKLLLLVGIVSLGTGAFLAIGLANRSATQSFDRFAQTVSGQSQIVVTPALGDFDLDALRALRRATLDSEATLVPQIVANARLAHRPDLPDTETYFTVIGMDLLAASNFLIRNGADRSFFVDPGEASSDADPIPFTAGAYSQAETATRFGWNAASNAASTLQLIIDDALLEIPFAGSIPQLESDQQAAANVLVMDWRELSETLGKPLHADRVDIVWNDPELRSRETDRVLAALTAANPGNWIIESQEQRQKTGDTMTLALRMNLRALSALSLLVAICLVFQSMDSAVARRQSEVATLHSLGVSTKLTRLLWIADSTLIGILGGGLGLLLGHAMATVSSELVGQTVNTLYYKTGDVTLQYSVSEAAIAWIVTILCCAIAGWWPARQAARAPLIETIRQAEHRSTYSRRAYLGGASAFALLSAAAYSMPPVEAANGHSIPVGGYALALFLIGLFACLACVSLELVGKLARPLGKNVASLRTALSQFRMPVTRHRLALSGVILAVGMTASMIFLIGSFESTVKAWIANTLQADLFLRSKAVSAAHDEPRLSIETVDKITSDPRIQKSATIYSNAIRINNLPTTLLGFDTDYLASTAHTTWIDAPENLLELKNGDTAIINETFASRFDVDTGDSLSLPGTQPAARFRIIGIYADYGNEAGSFGISRERFVAIGGDPNPRALALHARNPDEITTIARDLEAAYPTLQVMTNRWLREETLRIFNRVFSITYALQVIGLIISVAGLGTMLASLLVERRDETSALRRIGLSCHTLSLAALWEGLALAGLAILAGIALGLILGLVLVFIINKQSFGWTLAVYTPWTSLLGLAGLTALGAAVTAYLVGRWSASQPIHTEE